MLNESVQALNTINWMRDARCEMRDARCEMRDARCERLRLFNKGAIRKPLNCREAAFVPADKPPAALH